MRIFTWNKETKTHVEVEGLIAICCPRCLGWGKIVAYPRKKSGDFEERWRKLVCGECIGLGIVESPSQ